jgi:AcrR family transcriptional regulator
MADDDEKLRADARANRDRILDVAREAFAADPAASLNSIAKSAGVGAGTLYRRFPSREALVLGVYRAEIDALVDLAPQLLAEHSPLQSFRLWCDRLAQLGRVKHGVADMLHAAISDQDLKETYWPMLAAVRQLMNACEGSGEIHPGADAEDFLMLLGFLWRIPPTPAGEARVKRLLVVAFRGLGAEDPPDWNLSPNDAPSR